MVIERPFLCNHNHPPYNNIIRVDNDEFIDIEFKNTFSPQKSTEFEFQITPIFADHDHDDLFYRGKFLPKLQTIGDYHNSIDDDEENFITMDFPPSTSSPSINTSCRLSFDELINNPHGDDDDYLERSNGLGNFIINNKNPEKSWPNKLKMIIKAPFGATSDAVSERLNAKQQFSRTGKLLRCLDLFHSAAPISSPLCQKDPKITLISKKLKASQASLRSLLRKCGCKDVSIAKAPHHKPGGNNKKPFKSTKVEQKKTLFGHNIGNKWGHPSAIIKKIIVEDKVMGSERSLSFSSSFGASSNSSFSSSSSISSSVGLSDHFYELNLQKRRYSFSSDIEGTIESAIAHCKMSQEILLGA